MAGGLFLLPTFGVSVPGLALPLAMAGLLSAVPILAVRIAGRLPHSLVAVFAALVLVTVAASLSAGLAFLTLFGGWALLAGEALSRRRSVILAGIVGFAILSVEAAVASVAGGAAVAEATLDSPQVQKAFDQAAAQASLSPGDAKAAIDDMRAVIVILHPALSVISAAVVVAFNVMAIARMAQMTPGSAFPPHELLFLRWPLSLVVSFVVSGALLLVPALKSVAWNGLVVTLFLFLLQGLSVASFGLARLFTSELMRALLLAAMLLGPWAILLSFLGLFDQWFDFRNRLVASDGPSAA